MLTEEVPRDVCRGMMADKSPLQRAIDEIMSNVQSRESTEILAPPSGIPIDKIAWILDGKVIPLTAMEPADILNRVVPVLLARIRWFEGEVNRYIKLLEERANNATAITQ
jgi:hypothetical protein